MSISRAKGLTVTVVRGFFTWIALGDVDLRFLLTLVRKPMLLKRKLDEPRGNIPNVINPYASLVARQ
jgi:hypothetical protein